MLEINKKVPNFSVIDYKGNSFTQNNIINSFNVLYFYPKDSTPGCTNQALDFSKLYNDFKNLNTDIYGISKDSVDSHIQFKSKYDLSIPLLSDPTLEMHKSFGAYGTKISFGKTVQGVIRSTYIIDSNLKLLYYLNNVLVKNHADFILQKIKSFLKVK